jgi:hypothetical protein
MQQSVRMSRRTFVAWVGGASAGFYLFGRSPGMSAPEALAQIPGGTLDPSSVPKFQTPLLIPPVIPRAGTITMPGGKPADYYEISMRQFSQQILPTGLPATTVWGYGAVKSASSRGLLLHHAPSLTIEAMWKRPVRIKWTEGTWYDFFAGKAASKFGVAWGRGFAIFQYPNDQRESTLWYHDHALGMTRLNVYAGPAGFFLVRGGPEGDKAVLDSRSGTTAVLPSPAPEGDRFPSNKTYYEIPIAIQDRSFNTNGSLFYPDTRAFFDGITGPYIPDTDVSPIWNPEFFGNMIMVNGNTWPFQIVEQRRYRLRFLNGCCQSRFLSLDFANIPGIEVWQIGNEGGFLAAPVNLTADNGNRLLMALAERADLIVDFTNVPVGNHVLRNVGPDEPFGGGVPGVDFPVADPGSTGQVMQVPCRPRGGARPHHAAAVPRAPGDHPPHRRRTATTGPPGACLRGLRGRTGRGTAGHRHGRPEHRNSSHDGEGVGGARHREPCSRRHRSLGVLQRDRRRPPDAHPRGRLPGRQPTGDPHRRGDRNGSGRCKLGADAARAVGERLEGHRHRLPRPGDQAATAIHQPRPVRLALPHRRARGQRDDAPLPHRTATTRTAT